MLNDFLQEVFRLGKPQDWGKSDPYDPLRHAVSITHQAPPAPPYASGPARASSLA